MSYNNFRGGGRGNRGNYQGPPSSQFKLPPGYLDNGYFDDEDELREEYITSYADTIARDLGTARPTMTSSQLRRFFQHLRGCESKMQYFSFDAIRSEVKKLDPLVKEAFGKGKVSLLYKDFIEKNVNVVGDRRSFYAFIDHFQSVIAYFTFYEKS